MRAVRYPGGDLDDVAFETHLVGKQHDRVVEARAVAAAELAFPDRELKDETCTERAALSGGDPKTGNRHVDEFGGASWAP